MPITMPRKIELAQKHAKKFASKSAATPVLNGIHYAAGGAIYVTDRHRLLHIRNAHVYADPFTAHAKTGATIDGVYPDCSRIIPQSDGIAQITVTGDICPFLNRAKIAFDLAKVTEDIRNLAILRLAEGIAELAVSDEEKGVAYTATLNGKVTGENVEVAFNAEFLYDALNVFKDAGTTELRVKINGKTSPIVITDEANEIDVILLPYRLPSEGGNA